MCVCVCLCAGVRLSWGARVGATACMGMLKGMGLWLCEGLYVYV